MDEHQAALGEMLERSDWPANTGTAGKLFVCPELEECLLVLRKARIPIVLCDSEMNWRQLIEDFRNLPDPPHLILTSRIADDRLWSEALNLGAYDVLAKPFDSKEVVRVLTMAWTRWNERSTEPFPPVPNTVLTQRAWA